MPLYEFSCECGKTADEFRRLGDRNAPKECECGKLMTRVITSYRAIGDVDPYYDENLESWVKSKQDRKRIMREQGVSEAFGKGWR
jgi:putative FmdB family regulatory protein